MIRGGIVTLLSRDVGNAVRFYIETLGMKLVAEHDGVSLIDTGDGFHIELRPGTTENHASCTVSIGLHPKLPLAEAMAILENRGVVFRLEDAKDATLAHFEDLDGTALYLRHDKQH